MSDLSHAHYTLILTSNTQQYSYLWKKPGVLWKDSQWNHVLDCYTLCYLLSEFSKIVLCLQMASIWARLWNFCSSTGYKKIWISWVLVLFLYGSLLFCTCSEACRAITTSVCNWAKVSPFQLVCFACFLGNFYSASHLGGQLQYLLSFYLHSRIPHSGFSACLINTLSA